MRMLATTRQPSWKVRLVLGTMAVIILLATVIGVTIYRSVMDQRNELAQAQREKAALGEKIQDLERAQNGVLFAIDQAQREMTALKDDKSELESKLSDAQKQVEELKKAQKAGKASALSSKTDLNAISQGRESKWVTFKATAYTAFCDTGCMGITATGYDVRDSSVDHRVIAVDPRIIPLHSIVEIEGLGYFKAIDTGGAIKGKRIDILAQTEKQADRFGVQERKVRIVRRGKTPAV